MTGENRSLFLKEDTYQFRTCIADKPFDSGIHYWELIADSSSDNEPKVGVTKNREFDFRNSAFSDFSFGWAFYGVG
jgi:hypothetical protein